MSLSFSLVSQKILTDREAWNSIINSRVCVDLCAVLYIEIFQLLPDFSFVLIQFQLLSKSAAERYSSSTAITKQSATPKAETLGGSWKAGAKLHACQYGAPLQRQAHGGAAFAQMAWRGIPSDARLVQLACACATTVWRQGSIPRIRSLRGAFVRGTRWLLPLALLMGTRYSH